MDEFPDDIIRRELAPDEQLLWAGYPRQGFVLRPTDAFLIPFSILWGGFAVFWEATVIADGAPALFVAWGVALVLVGLHLIFGRFWVDARQRARTTYGVTSERVVIISGLLSRSVKSLSIDTLSEVSLAERSGGGGTILFGSIPLTSWWYADMGWPPGLSRQVIPLFDLPTEAREVYEIIRGAQRASRQRP